MRRARCDVNAERDNLDALLRDVAAGRLDELTPAQVELLAAHVDSSPESAARLGAVVPAADSALAPPIPAPSEAEWARVWRAVEAGGAASSAPRLRMRLGWARPLVALAACVGFAVVWVSTLGRTPAAMGGMSADVEISELAVADGYTSSVSVGEDGSAIIWVMESDDEPQGA